MFSKIKRILYFPIAYYFRFFAKIKLSRWNPQVIAITGSTGKTTTLDLVESQLGDRAFYSHHANSAYGISFNILGIKRETLQLYEWVGILFSTPFKTFTSFPKQRLYVVEADCDRPHEGKFLATLLKPNITIWLSSSRTHSMNFDRLVKSGRFKNVEEAIAYEFGYFLKYTKDLSMINGDSELIKGQLNRTDSQIIELNSTMLKDYNVSKSGTKFEFENETFVFKSLLPEATFMSILVSLRLCDILNVKPDKEFSEFKLPPRRSSVFKGIKNITIIDSTYNTGLAAMTAVLNMFYKIKGDNKWIVIGDILEQGENERSEHVKLANLIVTLHFNLVITLGPRIAKYGMPILQEKYKNNVISFLSPKEVLDYLASHLEGGEIVLFKGARFLEGVIADLLLDESDVRKLPRREKAWEMRRKKWGL